MLRTFRATWCDGTSRDRAKKARRPRSYRTAIPAPHCRHGRRLECPCPPRAWDYRQRSRCRPSPREAKGELASNHGRLRPVGSAAGRSPSRKWGCSNFNMWVRGCHPSSAEGSNFSFRTSLRQKRTSLRKTHNRVKSCCVPTLNPGLSAELHGKAGLCSRPRAYARKENLVVACQLSE